MREVGAADNALDVAMALARLAADTRCRDVVLLDVRRRSPVAKFFLIATGISPRQMRTAGEALAALGKASGFKAWRSNGYDTAKWILIDFVEIVAHLFDGHHWPAPVFFVIRLRFLEPLTPVTAPFGRAGSCAAAFLACGLAVERFRRGRAGESSAGEVAEISTSMTADSAGSFSSAGARSFHIICASASSSTFSSAATI